MILNTNQNETDAHSTQTHTQTQNDNAYGCWKQDEKEPNNFQILNLQTRMVWIASVRYSYHILSFTAFAFALTQYWVPGASNKVSNVKRQREKEIELIVIAMQNVEYRRTNCSFNLRVLVWLTYFIFGLSDKILVLSKIAFIQLIGNLLNVHKLLFIRFCQNVSCRIFVKWDSKNQLFSWITTR